MSAPILWFGNIAKLLKSALGIPGSTSGTVTIAAPATVTDYTVTMPNAQGSNGDVLQNDGSGNLSWVPMSGGGGGGIAGSLSILEQKLGSEDYNVFTMPVPNSVGQSFNVVQNQTVSYLWEDYSSGTNAVLVHDPVFLRATDEDTDSTTNWAVQNAGANLTATNTAGEFKVGTHGLKFDKNNTNVRAALRYDAGSLSKSVAGFTECFAWYYLPSLSDLSNIELRIDKDGSNYETYTTTTNSQGGALQVGWNFLKFDLSVAGTSTGTGWDYTELFRYFHLGVNTGSAATTYTGMIIDGVVFSQSNPSSLGIKTYKRSIYNTTTAESLIVSSASTNSSGYVTLAAGLSNAYVCGYKISTHAEIKRETIQYSNGDAVMINGLSGQIADTQTARALTILPESLTSQDFDASIGWYTDMTFTVLSVVDSDTITVSDLADSTANIVSGVVFDVYEAIPTPSGNNAYVSRNLALTVSSSSASSGVTTINTGTNTGIQVGDLIVMRQLANERLSLVSASANENFQSLSILERTVVNAGLPYPVPTQILANWNLGGKNQTIATVNNKSSVGAAQSLTVNGTIAFNIPFLNNQFGAGPFSSANYFSHPADGIAGISADNSLSGATGVFSTSFWIYVDSIPGATQIFLAKTDIGAGGWMVQLLTSSGKIRLVFNTVTYDSNNALNVGQWNHVAFAWNEAAGTNGNTMWVNGIATTFNGNATSDAGQQLYIGRWVGGDALANAKLAQLIFWANYTINQAIVDQIYNSGRGVIVGNSPSLLNRYEITGLTGQKLSIEADLTRTTDASNPFIQFLAAAAK